MAFDIDTKDIHREQKAKNYIDKYYDYLFKEDKRGNKKLPSDAKLKQELRSFYYPGIREDIASGKIDRISEAPSFEPGYKKHQRQIDRGYYSASGPGRFFKKVGGGIKKTMMGEKPKIGRTPIVTELQQQYMDDLLKHTKQPQLEELDRYRKDYYKPFAQQIMGDNLQDRLQNMAAFPEAFGSSNQQRWPSQQSSDNGNQQILANLLGELGGQYGGQALESAYGYGKQGLNAAQQGLSQGAGAVKGYGNKLLDLLSNMR